jgi:hypothetical protein
MNTTNTPAGFLGGPTSLGFGPFEIDSVSMKRAKLMIWSCSFVYNVDRGDSTVISTRGREEAVACYSRDDAIRIWTESTSNVHYKL